TALTLICAAIVGAVFQRRFPFPDNEFLVVLTAHVNPWLYQGLKWTWVTMLYTTPALVFAGVFSMIYIYVSTGTRRAKGELPPFPAPGDHESLRLVIGEVHHPRRVEPVDDPRWLTIPERGMFTGIAVIGSIGSGKTTAAMRPFATQILSWRAKDPARRVGGLVLEVKGDFCYQVKDVLQKAGRPDDYVELSMAGEHRYNPLHSDQEAFALAYSIASLLNQLYGKGKEPFWQQAYTNLVKFIIVLHKVVDDYCTLFNVYECAINPDRLKQKITEGEQMFAGIASAQAHIVIDPLVYVAVDALESMAWETDGRGKMRTPYTDELAALLDAEKGLYQVEAAPQPEDPERLSTRLAQFEAVKRWYQHDWMRLDNKLRTSIVEGISVFLSLFDDSPLLKRLFCPPKECYDPIANADGRYGRPLPSMSAIIESGKVLALNFPMSSNPATSRMIACLLKQEFQRAMLDRIPQMAAEPERHFREAVFLCDEYHELATVGESDPNGDEKFFALSRQAKCIPIVATQSISSLKSTLPGESWRTLLQCFRTKLFLSVADDFTAKVASDMAGRTEQMTPSYSISESGQDVRVSALSGRAQAHKAGVTLNKNYSLQVRPLFEPKLLMELGNAQCVAIPYDGVNPLPPTMCYLKPWFVDREMSYFEQRERRLI
ncbi:MAG TPA: TraM recognition domain-containing protein, partial [Bryobacteraceae bacterium]|nr:TraM recognition domain-containing protein [Bryobacteraceae bacterium]